MNESKPSEHIMNEAAMPLFLRYRTRREEYGYPSIKEMKIFMFDNIRVGDMVRIDSWLPVTNVDGDNITIAGAITTGRESIVGYQQSGRTLDEIWAGLTAEQKRALIHGVT